MYKKILILNIFFFHFYLNTWADEKQLIINYLLGINNFSFSFEQVTKEKIETGNCLLVFDNKLKCNYNDKMQKEMIINNNKLVILQKRYDKTYFYPISKSLLISILNKEKLIKLIQKSDLILNEKIELTYIDDSKKKIKIFFKKTNYELIGWVMEDKFQNEIYFSIKIEATNAKIDNKNFKIPSIY